LVSTVSLVNDRSTTISSNQGIANVPTVWSIQDAGAD